MKPNQIGVFSIKIIGAEYKKSTNIINKMDPYFTLHQKSGLSKKKRRLHGSRKLMKSTVWSKGHKTPIWNEWIKLRDFSDYDPVFYIKSKNNGLITSELIGVSKLDLKPYREIGFAEKVEYPVQKHEKVVGVLRVSFKYKPAPGLDKGK